MPLFEQALKYRQGMAQDMALARERGDFARALEEQYDPEYDPYPDSTPPRGRGYHASLLNRDWHGPDTRELLRSEAAVMLEAAKRWTTTPRPRLGSNEPDLRSLMRPASGEPGSTLPADDDTLRRLIYGGQAMHGTTPWGGKVKLTRRGGGSFSYPAGESDPGNVRGSFNPGTLAHELGHAKARGLDIGLGLGWASGSAEDRFQSEVQASRLGAMLMRAKETSADPLTAYAGVPSYAKPLEPSEVEDAINIVGIRDRAGRVGYAGSRAEAIRAALNSLRGEE